MVSYTIYVTAGPSRILEEKAYPEEAAITRLEHMAKIDYLMQSMLEDLNDLIPGGYTLEMVKEGA